MAQAVAEGIWRIPLAWGNAYLLADSENAALIDCGLAQDRPQLLAALQDARVPPERVRHLYLTHAHCDHAGNAAFLAREYGARIAMHRDEAPYLRLPRRTYAPTGLRLVMRPAHAFALTAVEWVYPVERTPVERILEDGEEIDAPGGRLRVVACPGHTPGHLAFFRERDGLLFSGDAVMNIVPNLLPSLRRTAPSLPVRLFSSDWGRAIQSARRLAELRPGALLAGHGLPLLADTARVLDAWAKRLP